MSCMNPSFPLPQIAHRLLDDALRYLVHIQPSLYSEKQELLLGASIGEHTRHFIEFFQCLLDQIQGSPSVINYALRQRDYGIEQDPMHAATQVRQLQKQLNALKENQSCLINCGEHLSAASSYLTETNLERELLYNIDHTIHHLAIIKIGLLAKNPQFDLPPYFGYMPSTIQYQE